MEKTTLRQVQFSDKAKLTEKGVVLEVQIPWVALDSSAVTLHQLRGYLGQGVELTIQPTQAELFDESDAPRKHSANAPLVKIHTDGLDFKRVNRTVTTAKILKGGRIKGAFEHAGKTYFAIEPFEHDKPSFDGYEIVPAIKWNGDDPVSLKQKDKDEKLQNLFPYPFTGVALTYRGQSYVVGNMATFVVGEEAN